MTLGSGARHSERNGSADEPMRFLQFWILPDTPSLPPSVEQRQFEREDRLHRLRRVIGPEGGEVVKVNQDASTFVAALEPGDQVEHEFGDGRAGYLYVIAGALALNDVHELETGDAVKALGPEGLGVRAERNAELILIEVPSAYEPVGVWTR
jgi:redox-sensitive bicupin YhaK (pirin superfamily)